MLTSSSTVASPFAIAVPLREKHRLLEGMFDEFYALAVAFLNSRKLLALPLSPAALLALKGFLKEGSVGSVT
jgi:hypothetical protein